MSKDKGKDDGKKNGKDGPAEEEEPKPKDPQAFENCWPQNPGIGCYFLYTIPFFIGLAPMLFMKRPPSAKCQRRPPRPPCC